MKKKALKKKALKKKKKLLDNLDNTFPVYMEWKLTRWLKGIINEFELSEIKEYLPECKEGTVIITNLKGFSESQNLYTCEEKDEILKNIKYWINDVLSYTGTAISFYLNDSANSLATILIKNSELPYNIDFEELESVINTIKTSYCIDVAIGISKLSSDIYFKAYECFNEALTAASLSFYLDEVRVISYSEANFIGCFQPTIDLETEERICDCIYNSSENDYKSLLEDILQSILQKGYVEPEQIKETFRRLFVNILKKIQYLMPEKQFNDAISMIISRINGCDTIIELKNNSISIIEQINSIHKSLKGRKNNILMERCLDYIDANYMEDISLDNISNKFAFNSSYFCTMFKEVTGVNFTKYLLKIRIKKSCELLRETDMRIYEIALAVGYKDAKYFDRVFKREMKVSPDEYRHLSL